MAPSTDARRGRAERAARDEKIRWLLEANRAAPRASRYTGGSGTATYAHTLMRVRSMSEKALRNRVRAIERAHGKHALVKMRMFAEVLEVEGYDGEGGVAEAAREALARLREGRGGS